MGWERGLYDAVNAEDPVALGSILSGKAVRLAIGRTARWAWGAAPLHLAAQTGQIGAIKRLVEAGADVNSCVLCKSGDAYTVLHGAVISNDAEAVRTLLALGADRGLEGKWGRFAGTPLKFAQMGGREDIVGLLGGRPETPPTLASVARAGHVLSFRQSKEQELKGALALLDQVRRYEGILVDAKTNLRSLKADARYRSELEIAKLTEEIEAMDKPTTTTSKAMTNGPRIEPDEAMCRVCYEEPKEVYSCLQCDNWVCGRCKEQLVSCPSCRDSFVKRSPVRNRAVERLLRGRLRT